MNARRRVRSRPTEKNATSKVDSTRALLVIQERLKEFSATRLLTNEQADRVRAVLDELVPAHPDLVVRLAVLPGSAEETTTRWDDPLGGNPMLQVLRALGRPERLDRDREWVTEFLVEELMFASAQQKARARGLTLIRCRTHGPVEWRPDDQRCAWCSCPLPRHEPETAADGKSAGGRPRQFCRTACRQMAYKDRKLLARAARDDAGTRRGAIRRR